MGTFSTNCTNQNIITVLVNFQIKHRQIILENHDIPHSLIFWPFYVVFLTQWMVQKRGMGRNLIIGQDCHLCINTLDSTSALITYIWLLNSQFTSPLTHIAGVNRYKKIIFLPYNEWSIFISIYLCFSWIGPI